MRKAADIALISALMLTIVGTLAARAAPFRDLNTVTDGQVPATKKQWFVPVMWILGTGQIGPRTAPFPISSSREFYDDVMPSSYPPPATPWGGQASWGAIKAVITRLDYIDGPLLTGFGVRAEVTNDLYVHTGVLGGTSDWNTHFQRAPDIYGQQPENMYEVRLTAEFADDIVVGNLPTGLPYIFGTESGVFTVLYDYLSWYCYSTGEPPVFPFVSPGGYWVPTFSMTGPYAQDPTLGTPDVIEPGDTHYRDLNFALRTPVPPGNALHDWLVQAKANGDDLFMNRTRQGSIGLGGLKIARYPVGFPYKDAGLVDDTSTVSVFYNPDPPAKDWGDAPDPTYPTLALSGGAYHDIAPHFYLGSGIDSEADGQPDAAASGDDTNGVDDEDGVFFTSPLNPGTTATVDVIASAPGMIDAWIDFDNSGAWGDSPGEQIFVSQAVSSGVNSLSFAVPSAYQPGIRVYARFRLSSTGGLSPMGPAYDGEVEDYLIGQEFQEPLTSDMGDAPDSTNNMGVQMTAYPLGGPPGIPANFPTVFGAGSPPYGPKHNRPMALAYLGSGVTLENEADIGPDQDAVNNIDPNTDKPDSDKADDGVQLPLVLPNCTQTMFNYTVTVTQQIAGVQLFVNVWFDWNRDGDWDDTMQCPTGPANEWAVQNQALGSLTPGTYTLTTPGFLPWHPAGAGAQPIWMRITLSEQPWQPTGMVGEGGSGPSSGYLYGETEDYYFTPDLNAQDWGDAPDPTYPTLRASNGASHTIVPGVFLGTLVDAETDGQPDPQALGDDLNGMGAGNDDDGIRNLSMLAPGQQASFNVVASTNGMLDAWIDFGRDGSWAEPGDQICVSVPVVAGVTPITFPVPPVPISNPGVTFARLRFSTAGGLPFVGPAPDGEVEDYVVRISDPIKWLQSPDLTPQGIDVNATMGTDGNYILADDFECTTTGPITDIHIWGSWANDIFPGGDPGGAFFTLSIHEDIPASQSPTGYSMPGKVLWTGYFAPPMYDWLQVATVRPAEGWLDPPSNYNPLGDTMVFRYDFYLDQPGIEPFIQRGTPENPVIYWLDVNNSIIDAQPLPLFGWKTRDPNPQNPGGGHFSDDAVWTFGTEPYEGPWNELRYPSGHELQGKSIDLAFAITGSESTEDWGDAPDPTYPTLAASNGARHTVVPGFCLGNTVDVEPDGQPTWDATGDDMNPVPSDEDGLISLGPLVVGQNATMVLQASAPGFLDAWFDFGADGSWAEPGDQIFASQPLVMGTNTLTFLIPSTAKPGVPTFLRLRFSGKGGLSFTGPAPDGEVEDYMMQLTEPEPELDFGDAPDPTYPTLLASNGARHVIVPNVFLGSVVDAEADGQPDAGALGDDNNGVPDDEDGVVFTTPFIPGVTAKVDVTASVPGMLDAWIDYAADGSWAEAGDQVFASVPLNPGLNSLSFVVPATAAPAGTFARFRFSTSGGLSYFGAANDGEVEDYAVKISPKPVIVTKGDAKKQPVGSWVLILKNPVTANFGTAGWYFEETDRSAALGVLPDPSGLGGTWAVNDLVSCYGYTVLSGCELMVQEVYSWLEGQSSVSPTGQNNRNSGGGPFGSQPGLTDDVGVPRASSALNTVALLVRLWGRCTYIETDAIGSQKNFWIDDGSALWDGTLDLTGAKVLGLKVQAPASLPNPIQTGKYYVVTGIMRTDHDPSATFCVRWLWPRSPGDVLPIP